MGFRKDFIWGAATASFQVEGAAFEGGRGRCIWDDYSHTHGKVYQDHNGDVASDHYHKMKEDVQLMADLGIKNYRFSLSWSRIIPEGTGAVNQEGLKFYSDLVDELLAHGITPFVTLFHWDYPSALQAKGAWENPDSVQWYLDYVEVVLKALGDRVKNFITFNEPQCFIGLGYALGVDGHSHAPGIKLGNHSLVPMAHRVMLSHGRAVKLIRKLVPDAKVGYAPCAGPRIPASNSPADIEAARRHYFSVPEEGWPWCVTWWSDPVMLGRYPEDGLKLLGQYLPEGWEEDLKEMHQPLDYYCQNIYEGVTIRAADNAEGWEQVPLFRGHPKTAIQWPITPECLYWGPRFLWERYKTPFIISENGMSAHDAISLDGKVHDPNREDYMHRYLLAYRRAADDGVDVRGYFAWSLMDNYEWAYGYSERFGLVYVDYSDDCRRIPKDSAWWYKKVMESNGENL